MTNIDRSLYGARLDVCILLTSVLLRLRGRVRLTRSARREGVNYIETERITSL
jgi:hypothetical protein